MQAVQLELSPGCYGKWGYVVAGEITGNFAEIPALRGSLASNRSSNSMACRQIPYATEQGIFGGITGNFFQRTGNSRAGAGNSTSGPISDPTRVTCCYTRAYSVASAAKQRAANCAAAFRLLGRRGWRGALACGMKYLRRDPHRVCTLGELGRQCRRDGS